MSLAHKILNSMSLEDKIGQLLMIGIPSPSLSKETRSHLKKIKPGGIIYFSRNIQNPEQVKELSTELQDLTRNSQSPPLFISTDQEGGAVMRIAEGVTVFPGNMALGATRSASLSYQVGRITAEELYLLGINMNLAPVLDVNNNPKNPVIGLRSFGEDPKLVGELGSAYILGVLDAKVIATGKHFPGHGDTEVDSHLSLPVVPHQRERLFEVELNPFIEAIDKGLPAIMTAHVVFPSIEDDKTIPATLSSKVLTGLLRNELGFQGLILTDCMEMNAISNTYGTVEGAIKTILAGADIVLISHTQELQQKAFSALVEAVLTGRLPEKRLDESVLRILETKEKFGILNQEWCDCDNISLKALESVNVARSVAQSSITLLKGEELLPLKGKVAIIDLQAQATTVAEDVVLNTTTLGAITNDSTIETFVLPFLGEYKDLVEQIASSDATIFVFTTLDAHRYQEQISIIKELRRLKPNVTIFAVGLRTPYEFSILAPYVNGYLATYSYRGLSLAAAWDVLTGKVKAPGKLPITVE